MILQQCILYISHLEYSHNKTSSWTCLQCCSVLLSCVDILHSYGNANASLKGYWTSVDVPSDKPDFNSTGFAVYVGRNGRFPGERISAGVVTRSWWAHATVWAAQRETGSSAVLLSAWVYAHVIWHFGSGADLLWKEMNTEHETTQDSKVNYFPSAS